MNDQDYHGDYSHVSNTMLGHFIEDRTKFRDFYIDQTVEPPGSTKAMDVGSILHALILEERPLRSIVGVYPDHDPRLEVFHQLTGPKKAAMSESELKSVCEAAGVGWKAVRDAKGGAELKELQAAGLKNVMNANGAINGKRAAELREERPEYEYWMKKHGGSVASPSLDMIKASYNAFRSGPWGFLVGAENVINEEPIFWESGDGMKKRCKPDLLLVSKQDDKAICYDLKISQDALDFEAKMNKFRYWMQQIHYTEGIQAKHGVAVVDYKFLVHQPEYPFHTVAWSFAQDDIPEMRRVYETYIQQILECDESGDWSMPQDRFEQIASFWQRNVQTAEKLQLV